MVKLYPLRSGILTTWMHPKVKLHISSVYISPSALCERCEMFNFRLICHPRTLQVQILFSPAAFLADSWSDRVRDCWQRKWCEEPRGQVFFPPPFNMKGVTSCRGMPRLKWASSICGCVMVWKNNCAAPYKEAVCTLITLLMLLWQAAFWGERLMPAKLYLLFPLKKCLTDLMYKVTDVSAPALRPTTSNNGLLWENTVFAVWWSEKDFVNPCLWSADFCMKPCGINTQSIYYRADCSPSVKDDVYALSVCRRCPQVHIVSHHHNGLANVKITSPGWGAGIWPLPVTIAHERHSVNTYPPPASSGCTHRENIWNWRHFSSVRGWLFFFFI